MSDKLKHTLIVRHPDTMAPVALLEGTSVPAWAKDLVASEDIEHESKPAAKKAAVKTAHK